MLGLFRSKTDKYKRFLKSKYDLNLPEENLSQFINLMNNHKFSEAAEICLLEHRAAIHIYGMVNKLLDKCLLDDLPDDIDLDFIIEINRRADVIRDECNFSLSRCNDKNILENSEIYRTCISTTRFQNKNILKKFEIAMDKYDTASDEIMKLLNW